MEKDKVCKKASLDFYSNIGVFINNCKMFIFSLSVHFLLRIHVKVWLSVTLGVLYNSLKLLIVKRATLCILF